MSKRKSNKKRYNFLLDKDIYDDFSLICDEMGLVRSKNIEKHLLNFLEENKELLKKVKKR